MPINATINETGVMVVCTYSRQILLGKLYSSICGCSGVAFVTALE